MRLVQRPQRDERGAFLVLWTLLLVAMLIMVSLVIDLGSFRSDRRDNRRAADAAAAAGTLDLSSTALGRQQACQTAWEYAWRNLGVTGSLPTPSPACTTLLAPCTSATPPTTVTGTANGFTVSITTPVPDTDDLMDSELLRGDQAQAVTGSDGSQCLRLGVRVIESRSSFFGGIIGQGAHTTDVHTVALRLSSVTTIPASLVILEPHRCTAMLQSGTGDVLVEDNTVPPDRGGIVVLSDGTATGGSTGCSTSRTTIDSAGTGSIRVSNPGDIFLSALTTDQCSGTACQLSDVSSGHLAPDPVNLPPLPGLGRELVEYVYNCKSNYTTSGADPNYQNVAAKADGTGGTLAACDQALVDTNDRDYIDTLVDHANDAVRDFQGIAGALRQTVGTSGTTCTLPIVVLPLMQAVDVLCTVPGNSVVAVTAPNIRFRNIAGGGDIGQWVLNGNVYFDQRLDVGNGDTLTVNGNVVLGNGMQMSNGATATFAAAPGSLATCGSAANRWEGWVESSTRVSCLRQHTTNAGWGITRGSIDMTGAGTFTSNRIAWYGSSGAELDLNGNLTWSMPTDGPLDRLALWSDWAGTHSVSAGGSMVFEGVYFAPVAEFLIRGSFPTNPQSAQFIVRTFDISGNGTFRLAPDPRLIEIPVLGGVGLIR